MRLASLTNQELISYLHRDRQAHALAKEMQTDPWLPSKAVQTARRKQRTVGRRIVRLIQQLEQRGITPPSYEDSLMMELGFKP